MIDFEQICNRFWVVLGRRVGSRTLRAICRVTPLTPLWAENRYSKCPKTDFETFKGPKNPPFRQRSAPGPSQNALREGFRTKPEKTMEKRLKKETFWHLIFILFGIVTHGFPKLIKLLKSCSRVHGSTIFELLPAQEKHGFSFYSMKNRCKIHAQKREENETKKGGQKSPKTL